DPGWHGLRDPWTLLLLVPLITLLPILNVRIFPFVAPNEEPKWAVLVICGLLMGLSWAWALWKAGSLHIRPGAAGLLLAAFLLLLAAGIPVGPNPIEGLIRFTFWLIAAAVLVLAAWAMRTRQGWLDWLGWATSVASIVFSLGYWYGYVMKFGKPGYNVSVLFSPIGHVNFTGDVLVVLLPALIWMLAKQRSPILRVLNWFSVVTMTTVLLVAAGRGAIGGLMVGALVFLGVAVRHWLGFWREGRRPAVAPSVWVISALLVAVIVNAMLPYHYRELVRVSGTLEAAVEEKSARELDWSAPQPPFASFWAATYPVLTARTPMYASATAMALDAPWLGQGTGNFPFVYPAWSNRFPDFRDPLSTERTFTTNPHNIILQ
ncbi:MAG: O-antigen ligase domain-containing protein, partial [Gammaproteobacteria bacterium]